jgi:hypothetical protein
MHCLVKNPGTIPPVAFQSRADISADLQSSLYPAFLLPDAKSHEFDHLQLATHRAADLWARILLGGSLPSGLENYPIFNF